MHCRILEGEKERIQIFSGVVIARSGSGTRRCSPSAASCRAKGWSGSSPSTRRGSPRLSCSAAGVARRAKLYYLRDRVGKAVRLKERRVDQAKRDVHAAKSSKK